MTLVVVVVVVVVAATAAVVVVDIVYVVVVTGTVLSFFLCIFKLIIYFLSFYIFLTFSLVFTQPLKLVTALVTLFYCKQRKK